VTSLCDADLVIGSSWMAKAASVIDLKNSLVTLNLAPLNPAALADKVLRAASSTRSPCTFPNNITLGSRPPVLLSQASGLAPAISPVYVTPSPPDLPTTESIRAVLRSALVDLSPSDGETYYNQPHLSKEDYAELVTSEPQFWDPTDFPEDPEETKQLQSLIPKYLHDFFDIFRQKQGTETLPPHREYDMKIELRSSATLAAAKLYQLTEAQRQVLLETLDRELAAGRIRPSNASYGSPMFFVPKKDGRWRMVIDYRKVNAETVPDAYPLPLISQITNDLCRAKYFTKLDLVGAYQLLRMAAGEESKTAFRTQYGMFESCVVRDGLRNAPAVFQHFLNDVFKEVLGRGVTIYIDDILIYASELAELRRLTRKVFEIVQRNSLYLKASKCEFEVTSMTFLGYVVSHNGIETDPAKIESVNNFPVPTNLRESRSFIGLTSYYRRFVPHFSSIAAPITSLTQKDKLWEWGEPQQKAFNKLKRLLTSAPILAHFDPTRETIIQTDASHFGWGFIISQIEAESRREHPIAIESGRFTGAQLNYTTTEKEFMAIVKAFERNRHMLLQVDATVVTDHLNLTFWMEPRQLSPRQARWVELLSSFRFKIVYRPGKFATMPDALSRRSDYHPGKGATLDHEVNFIQALPQLSDDIPSQPIRNANIVLRALQQVVNVDRDYFIDDDDLRQGIRLDASLSEIISDMSALALAESAVLPPPRDSPSVANLRRTSRNPHITLPSWTSRQFLAFNNRVYVPDYSDCRLKILRARHDSPLAGHPGIVKTIELISRDYVWIGLRSDVETYVNGCAVCQRTKGTKQLPSGKLKSLNVPSRPWSEISMDFVEQLPLSGSFDSILVVVDRLTKWAIFIPTTTTLTSAQLAELLIDRLISQHGLPDAIVSDRGSKFTSKLWRYFMSRLGVNLRLSTAFHPQTDGQTERVNQVLEQYLRIFTSYNQDDWSTLLPQASLCYNNSIHSAIQLSPFFANYGYHPRVLDELKPTTTSEVPEGHRIAESLVAVHNHCSANIAEANLIYAKAYDKNHSDAPPYRVGDRVMLSMENIKTTRPMKKLDVRQSGPFEVLSVIGTHAYKLKLPDSAKIHDVFHVSLLRPFTSPTYPGQYLEPPTPIETEQDLEYEVSAIVDSRLSRSGKLEYLVEWLGYEGTQDHVSWEPIGNLTGSTDHVASFHLANPLKPSTAKATARRTSPRKR
jgi:transposase InsO family protein